VKNSSRDQISYNGVQEGVLKGSLTVCPPLQYIMHCFSIGAEELLLYRLRDEDCTREARPSRLVVRQRVLADLRHDPCTRSLLHRGMHYYLLHTSHVYFHNLLMLLKHDPYCLSLFTCNHVLFPSLLGRGGFYCSGR
jgi:hypothetical protein